MDYHEYIPPPNPLNTRSPGSQLLATPRVFSLTTRRPSPYTKRPHCHGGIYRCQQSLATRAAAPLVTPPIVEVRQWRKRGRKGFGCYCICSLLCYLGFSLLLFSFISYYTMYTLSRLINWLPIWDSSRFYKRQEITSISLMYLIFPLAFPRYSDISHNICPQLVIDYIMIRFTCQPHLQISLWHPHQ